MKLSEFVEKPLSEALKDMELVDSKIHTNDDGVVCTVELKYIVSGASTTTSTKKPIGKW